MFYDDDYICPFNTRFFVHEIDQLDEEARETKIEEKSLARTYKHFSLPLGKLWRAV